MNKIQNRLIQLMQYCDKAYYSDIRLITEYSVSCEDTSIPDVCTINTDNAHVLARFGELYAAYVFEYLGYEVAWPEVDDHGIDFIAIEKEDRLIRIQVKTIRQGNYAYITENKMQNMDYLALVRIDKQNHPNLYIYPSSMIRLSKETKDETNGPQLFKYRANYKKPEYGISTAEKFFSDTEFLFCKMGTWNVEKKKLPHSIKL